MSLDGDVEILARIEALRGIEPDALRLLAFAAPREIFEPGELLFERGQPAAGAFVILSGRIAVTDAAFPDRQTMVEEGGLLDEMAMYIETERAATAQAVHQATTMSLTRDIVRRVLMEFPASAMAVRDRLSGQLNNLSAEIGEVGKRLREVDEASAGTGDPGLAD